jgi:hypothetical protein
LLRAHSRREIALLGQFVETFHALFAQGLSVPMKKESILDLMESTGPSIGSLLGVVTGPTVALAVVTAVIVTVGHWSRGLGVALCIPVFLGSLTSLVELGVTIAAWRSLQTSYSRQAVNSLVFARIVVCSVFAVALIVLYHQVIHRQ